jgi:nitrate reductase gamma subunit
MISGHWTVPAMAIVVATYLLVAAFHLRLAVHALRWWEASRRTAPGARRGAIARLRDGAGALLDVLLLRRLLAANPALWGGEWAFHVSLSLVVLRHLRYFVEPVPAWVAWAQTPGWIAGFLLPGAVAYVLTVRLLTRHEQYSAPANVLLLLDVLATAATGLLLATRHRVDLVQVKVYVLGIVGFRPAPPPSDWLLAAHLALVAALVLFVPSHVFTAPLSMLDARRRDRERARVLHDA